MIYMGIFMQKFLKKFRQKPLFMLLPSAAVFLILSVLFLHFHQDADQAFSKYTSEHDHSPLHPEKSRKLWHK